MKRLADPCIRGGAPDGHTEAEDRCWLRLGAQAADIDTWCNVRISYCEVPYALARLNPRRLEYADHLYLCGYGNRLELAQDSSIHSSPSGATNQHTNRHGYTHEYTNRHRDANADQHTDQYTNHHTNADPGCSTSVEQCKNGGYRNFIDPSTGQSFKSQGRCIQYVNSGK